MPTPQAGGVAACFCPARQPRGVEGSGQDCGSRLGSGEAGGRLPNAQTRGARPGRPVAASELDSVPAALTGSSRGQVPAPRLPLPLSPCRRERTLEATHFVSQPFAVAKICARRRAHLAPGPAPPSNLDAAPWFPVPDTPCARHFGETEKTSPEERRGGRLASRNPCPRPVSLLHHLGLPVPRPTLPGPRAPRFLSPGPGRPRLQFLQPASLLSTPVPTPHI